MPLSVYVEEGVDRLDEKVLPSLSLINNFPQWIGLCCRASTLLLDQNRNKSRPIDDEQSWRFPLVFNEISCLVEWYKT